MVPRAAHSREHVQVLPLAPVLGLLDAFGEQPVVVDDHVGVVELADLAQLGRREADVLRAPADQDVDVTHGAATQCAEHRLGNVGLGHLVGRLGQHARHVEGHVPRTDDGDAGAVEHRLQLHTVGVAAVPAHERARAERARKVLARHPEVPIHRAARGVDDRVEMLAHHVQRYAAVAHPHPAQELDVGRVEGLLQHPDDRLHLHVVGRDAVPHQPVRRG